MSTTSTTDAGESNAIAASDPAASPHGDAKPAIDSRDPKTLRHQILTAVHAATQPAEAPPKWGFLSVSSKVRELRCPAAELADSLRARFSVAQLLDVGAFEQASGKEPTLNTKLGGPLAKLRFITRNEHFADIHSARGALAYSEMPAVRYARTRAAKGQRAPKDILLAATDDDVNLLSLLGQYCEWAAGLDAICGRDLRRIFRGDNLNPRCRKYRLLLVACQPASFKWRPDPLIVKILERFLQAEKFYGFDIESVLGVWLPQPQTITSIKLAIEFRDEKVVHDLVARSVTASVLSPVEALSAISQPPEPDYGAAQRNLTQLVDRCREIPLPNQVHAALRTLEDVYDKGVIQKYFQEAAASSHPGKKILLIHAARLATAFHQSQSIFDSARRVMAMETVQVPTRVSPDELKNQCHIVDELLKVLKAIEHLKR
jgi:hypothetical protein